MYDFLLHYANPLVILYYTVLYYTIPYYTILHMHIYIDIYLYLYIDIYLYLYLYLDSVYSYGFLGLGPRGLAVCGFGVSDWDSR